MELYLDFQTLRFPGALHFQCNIPPQLFNCQLPPRCLQTLAENALLHGMQGQTRTLKIDITGIDHGDTFTVRVSVSVSVSDSGIGIGIGIPAQRLAELGKRPLHSSNGNGSALYHL